MAAKQTVITDEGLKKLEQELEYWKTVRRKEVAEKLKTALSFGDLSENSEYDEAKNEQAILESQIAEREALLKNVRVLDESELTNETIHIGSTVKVKNKKTNKVCTYKIVGSAESDPVNGLISDESPVGKALLGAKVGQTVEVEIPAGIVKYAVQEISK